MWRSGDDATVVGLLEKDLRGLPERVGALETRVTAVVVQLAELRDEIRTEFASVRQEGDEETRRLMRVLHEDLVARISLIDRG